MKNLIATLLIGTTVGAHAEQLTYKCQGQLGDTTYLVTTYQGYGNKARIELTELKNGSVAYKVNAAATGGSFTECGSRANPCMVVKSTQYSSETPAIIFTLSTFNDSTSGTADLDIYGNGFGKSATQDLKVACHQ